MSADPIVIDPPNFDQAAAWQECREYVDKCGGLAGENGEPNWRAAAGADPGCCSCPACGKMYWAWGRVQRCAACAFEYPTDWWSMFSWGSQSASSASRYRHDERLAHPYYRYGFEHPQIDPWAATKTDGWRAAIRAAMTPTHPGANT